MYGGTRALRRAGAETEGEYKARACSQVREFARHGERIRRQVWDAEVQVVPESAALSI